MERGDGPRALGRVEEMQGQQTGRAVERPSRGVVDNALHQRHAIAMRCRGRRCEAQHLGSRIDTGEAPAGMGLGQRPRLEPATGAEDEDMGIVGHMFGEQHAGHDVEGIDPRHEAPRPLGIAGDGLGIFEGLEEGGLARVSRWHGHAPGIGRRRVRRGGGGNWR